MADEGEENEESLVQAFAAFPIEDTEKRPTCKRCKRPTSVCLCSYLPQHLLNIQTTVHILQHPKEESRLLTTVPILEASLQPEKCIIYRENRFHEPDYPELYNVFSQPNSLLLYPGPQAADLKTLDLKRYPEYNLIVLDGTWRQARNIFHCNPILNNIKQVVVEHHNVSEYVIRTQPTNQSLCTVEAVALALEILEDDIHIYKRLINPLKALCQFQLDHGALVHCSKEEKEKELLKE
ncbi:DTW domain-containing protein 2-like, partial [Actinia tenebrosa]|uniref:tRNA-uridine aminocarboxypropyltransferase n=1 Tax=Actinia tenebrosa TaxID=6105 RepID=A0A6P8IDS0_ACTTE